MTKLGLELRYPHSQSATFHAPVAFKFATEMESWSCKTQLKQFNTELASHTFHNGLRGNAISLPNFPRDCRTVCTFPVQGDTASAEKVR